MNYIFILLLAASTFGKGLSANEARRLTGDSSPPDVKVAEKLIRKAAKSGSRVVDLDGHCNEFAPLALRGFTLKLDEPGSIDDIYRCIISW
jgi:class 3 adenylate cyclase